MTRSRHKASHLQPTHPIDPPAYSIHQFCEAHRISRAYLYQLWNEGRGPRRAKLGRRILISGEAAADWRRLIEQETAGQGS